MMKYRYVVWILWIFYISIGTSLSASSLSTVNISATDIEKIVNEDISKLTPELVEDIFRGTIPGIQEKTMMEILQNGVNGTIATISSEAMEILLQKNISGFTPKIFQKIIRGYFPNIKEKTILIVLQKGIVGEVSGVTTNTIEKMIGKDFQGLSPRIVQSIILDSIGGGIPGLVDDDSLKIIRQNIKNTIPGITPLEIKKMIKNGISNLDSKILDNIIKDIVINQTVIINPKDIVDEIKQWTDSNIQEVSSTPKLNVPPQSDIQIAIEKWREKIQKNPIVGMRWKDGLPSNSQKKSIHWPGSFNAKSINRWHGIPRPRDIDTDISYNPSATYNSNNLGSECSLWYPPWFGQCGEWSCDTVLECAMGKERDAIEARLDDLINTIKANTKQTEHQTKIIEQEVLAYRRLEARVKKETLSLKEARYLSKKIKDSVSIGSTIETSKKGQ